ncbi:nucleotidyltransferase [Brevibacillus laterosporus]|uniref:tRNA(Met) cytidine acetate ligase n=1 Tax=Brevibacillus laterosporus TaxID=1465 RepID=A0A518VDH0_BRELA|nr:nucleotidyltransferase [Brevibacillus laterosporus]QDX95045.1 nucleotidyltransferase [Brevibacillus laterosporus]TPG68960.1 nucleotidyltransferase [Brevibacillus laterosporus]
MKTVGLIVEYNPLHNGHKLHFTLAKKKTGADACVAVMSGNFLQRGEPAIVSKWARTEMALQVGVDLVIELPTLFATSNAEMFAHGAVSLLDRIGIVDTLCFGSESGDISWMHQAAQILAHETPAFSHLLKTGLREGLPYPKAYAEAAHTYLADHGIHGAILDQPNNILGFNYLLSLARLNSKIVPATIQRQKAGYHQETITDEQIASATALRKLLTQQNVATVASYVPKTTIDVLHREWILGLGPITWEDFAHPLFHRLLQLTPEKLAMYHEIEEGMEYRLLESARRSKTVADIVTSAKSKRYTQNRIQRMLLNLLLDVKKEQISASSLRQGAPYARVLGFSQKGRVLLQQAKQKSTIPLYTNVRDGLHPMLDIDIRSNALYRLVRSSCMEQPFLEEYRRIPLQITPEQ